MTTTTNIESLRIFAVANNRHEFGHLCQLALNGVDWAIERVGSAVLMIPGRSLKRGDWQHVALKVIDSTDCEAPGGGLPRAFDMALAPLTATPSMGAEIIPGTLVQVFYTRGRDYVTGQIASIQTRDDGLIEAEVAVDDEPLHRALQCTHWDAVPGSYVGAWYRAFRVDQADMAATLSHPNLSDATRAAVAKALADGVGSPAWFLAAGLVAGHAGLEGDTPKGSSIAAS